MTTTAVRVPAGWYADPLSADASGQPTHRRWWDGHGWTHHTALIGHTPTSARSPWSVSVPESPDVSPAAVETLRLSTLSPAHLRREAASVAEKMSLHSASPVSVSTLSPDSAGDATDATQLTTASPGKLHGSSTRQTQGRHREVPSGPTRAHTLSLWLIATMPITQALVAQWVMSALPTSSAPQVTMWLGIALPFVLYAALASQDARQLSAAGHLCTVPWIVALVLPPVYVGVRGIIVARATGASPWPALLTWGALQVIVAVVITLVDPSWLSQLSAVTAL